MGQDREGGQEIGTGTMSSRIIVGSTSSFPSKNPCPICGDQSKLDGVISSCIDCFLSGGELYLYKYGVTLAFFLAKLRGGTCTFAPSDPPEEVIHRASYLLQIGNGFGVYDVFKNNCKDFAIYCKTGLLLDTTQGRSLQVASYVAAACLILSSPLSCVPAAGYGLYCVGRLAFDTGISPYFKKVPVETLVSLYAQHESQAVTEIAGTD